MAEETQAHVPMGVKAKLVGIGLLVGLIVGLVGTGYTWWTLRAELEEARQEHEHAMVEAREAAQDTEARLAHEQARNQLLQARTLVARSVLELDRRNFGTADDHRRAAAERLGQVNAAAAQVDADALAEVQGALQQLEIVVVEDLESQRARVNTVAARLDALLQ